MIAGGHPCSFRPWGKHVWPAAHTSIGPGGNMPHPLSAGSCGHVELGGGQPVAVADLITIWASDGCATFRSPATR
jgi:hypothetical protein